MESEELQISTPQIVNSSVSPNSKNLNNPKRFSKFNIALITLIIILLSVVSFLMLRKPQNVDVQSKKTSFLAITPSPAGREKIEMKTSPTLDPETAPLPPLGASSSEFVAYFNGDGGAFIKFFDLFPAFNDQQPTAQACKQFTENNLSQTQTFAVLEAISKTPGEKSGYNITREMQVGFYAAANRLLGACAAGGDKSKRYAEELDIIKNARIVLNRIFKQTGFR